VTVPIGVSRLAVRRQRERREQGSATVMSLAWLTVLAVVGAIALLVTLVAAAQHQVESAADLAAVSAATHVADGEPAVCAAATRVATSMHARITSCHLDGLDVTIAVASTVRIPARSVVLTASARAGPTEEG
jgi:secretion/DNA translocation related TadE-like protein